MNGQESRICLYSSLLIALVTNSPRLLALRANGVIAQYLPFNLGEIIFQFLFNLIFCAVLFYLNLQRGTVFSRYRDRGRLGIYFAANGLFILLLTATGSLVQHSLFVTNHLPGMYRMGYLARFGLSAILVGIIIRIILLLREARSKDKAHDQLKSAYLEAQIELLKEQLNPHLLFNSLSSLSGIVRENPKLAQFYIFHLSNVFRHVLVRSGTALVTVTDEIQMLRSYAQLLTMRLEKAFRLDIEVDEQYQHLMIPHLSLQPLLENAAKHNAATAKKPLMVRIYVQDRYLVISNNLQEITTPENSTGIGLVNLNERFRLLVHQEIDIIKTDHLFVVKLPLLI